VVPTPKVEGVDDFLSDDNIGRNMPILNESRLGVVNEVGEMRFKSIR
jgi:hypothetical protein